jgi:hypothetical protein
VWKSPVSRTDSSLPSLLLYCPPSVTLTFSGSSVILDLLPVTTPALQPRKKDRMSYSHQIVQVDLTQVIVPEQTDPKKKKAHELEVEVRDVPMLLEEAKAMEEQQENTYDLLLDVMLNSVRMLVKNAV